MTTITIHHERTCDGQLWAVLHVDGRELTRVRAERAETVRTLARTLADATHSTGVAIT